MDTQSGTDGNTKPTTIAATIKQLIGQLIGVTALGASVKGIAQDLPATLIEEEETVCPEVVFPVLAKEIIQHCNESLSLVEHLEKMLREQGVSTTE